MQVHYPCDQVNVTVIDSFYSENINFALVAA